MPIAKNVREDIINWYFQSTTKESVETFLWTLVFIVLEERLQIMYDNTEKSWMTFEDPNEFKSVMQISLTGL